MGGVNVSVGSDVRSQFLRQLLLGNLLLHNEDDEIFPSIHSFSISDHELLHSPFRL